MLRLYVVDFSVQRMLMDVLHMHLGKLGVLCLGPKVYLGVPPRDDIFDEDVFVHTKRHRLSARKQYLVKTWKLKYRK